RHHPVQLHLQVPPRHRHHAGHLPRALGDGPVPGPRDGRGAHPGGRGGGRVVETRHGTSLRTTLRCRAPGSPHAPTVSSFFTNESHPCGSLPAWMTSKKACWSFAVMGPRRPSPMVYLSTERMGVISAAVPVKNSSSA